MRKAAFEELLKIAKLDSSVFLAVSDVGAETVREFINFTPRQLLIEGIAEGHLLGMASGMAKEGNIVFVNTIASFLTKRAYEQIAINVCLENLNVKLLGQGGGLVYGQQGPTHHALDDIGLMRLLPNMKILVPGDLKQTKECVELAYRTPGPFYIRLAKGSSPALFSNHPLTLYEPQLLKTPQELLLISTGVTSHLALQVSEGIPGCGVLAVPVLKPFCDDEVARMGNKMRAIIVIEEHSEIGGLSSCVCNAIMKFSERKPNFMAINLGDQFIREYDKQEALLRFHGFDPKTVLDAIQRLLAQSGL